MKKMFKRSLAAVMAVASLAVGMVGMSASAVSETVNFHKDAGAPGSSTVINAQWNYTISLDTSTIKVSNFSATDSSTFILAGIVVKVKNMKNIGRIYPSGGSISADGLDIGESAFAYAEVNNVIGNIKAKVSISG